jgi:hypothetical protein
VIQFTKSQTKLEPSSLLDCPLDLDSTSFLPDNIDLSKLHDILKRMKIDTSLWGKGESKKLHSLFREIEYGIADLRMYQQCLTRIVIVVRLIVKDELGRQLIETKQVFNEDGRVRYRPDQHHINKKVRFFIRQASNGYLTRPEAIPVAARRALVEELDIDQGIDPYEYSNTNKIQYSSTLTWKGYTPSSQSFPGLPTVYFIPMYDVLLEQEYVKAEYIYRNNEITTYFHWHDPE